MGVNKIEIIADGQVQNTINFNEVVSGLSAGSHTITVKAYDGNTELHSQTKNITIPTSTVALPNVSDLIFAYKCEETSGVITNEAGINGTAFGSLQRGVSGKIGNGYYFNGTNAYVNTNSSLNITGKTYTLSTWIKKNNGGDLVEVLNQRDTNNGGLRFFIDGDKMRFTYFGVAGYTSNSIPSLSTTNWNHCVWVVIPSGRVYMYVNSVLEYDTSISAGVGTSTNAVIGGFIDNSNGNVSTYTRATKDEIYLWDADLRSEVGNLYNNGNGITY